MFNRFYSFAVALATMLTVNVSAQTETKYAPTLDVNFRTASGNTAWNSGYPKSAANEGNKDFELTYAAGLFALQKYTVPDIQNATKLVLTLTVGSKSGVDAVRLWSIPLTAWDASTGVNDIVPAVTTATGVAPRATEGTANSPLVTGAKVAESNPAKATWTITGTALATIKANAAADGTFTLLLTNNDLLNSNNKRSYLSSSSANDEVNRPTLVATIETPVVVNKTTGVGYSSLNDAFAALTGDGELVINDDTKLTDRCTLNQAYTVSITAAKDVTIKGPKNKMWFLANVNNATLIIGNKDHKITLDGINDDRSSYSNVDVTRRENSTKLYLTNIEFKDFTCGANHLVGCKNNGGAIYLEDITFTNCSSIDALISNLREANDALLLKGFLNVGTDCSGTTIYTAKNRIRLGDPDGSSIYQDFSASNEITIGWGGTFAEGTVVVIKVPASAKDKFSLVSDDWKLERKASNGDMYMVKAGWLDPMHYDYTHPGLLHTADDIIRVKDNLSSNSVLFNAAYQRLENQSGGNAAGAVEYLKRMDKSNWEEKYPDYSNFTRAATDAKLAYQLALRYQLKGSTAAATKAVGILNDWATTCKGVLRLDGYTNNIPDPNEYLLCIQAYQFANAAELLRGYNGWQDEDFMKFQSWIRETFGRLAYEFLENHHGNKNALHYWLNWDLAALNALMSVGVLCDDKALVDYALNYVDNGTGTGNKANAIVATHQDPDSEETLAQCQESGRDQGHSTLDVTLMGVLCRTAQNCGANVDLFTSYNALEMAEYVGKYNLKNQDGSFVYSDNDVPFTAYINGEVEHTAISADARGTERPCWELFHAYAKKNNKAAAYTEGWVKYFREKNAYGEGEATSTDELGFGTLMFGAEAIPTAISTAKTGAAQVNVTEYFDLSGRRVAQPTKGLYIVNGKKVIVK